VVQIHPAVPANSLQLLIIEGALSAQTTVRICTGSKEDPKIFFVEKLLSRKLLTRHYGF
jgi:hypothetical protein